MPIKGLSGFVSNLSIDSIGFTKQYPFGAIHSLFRLYKKTWDGSTKYSFSLKNPLL